MTIEKLPSGSYRIRKQINGERYALVVDHRPTKKEAEALLAEVTGKPRTVLTLYDAAQAYVDARRNILSPSTLRGYNKLLRGIPDRYRDMRIREMVSGDLQAIANEYSEGRSRKTIRNMVCFLQSVLKDHDIMLRTPSLPQEVKKEDYIPTADDMRKIFEHIRGSEHEVSITLAALGLRRSEIVALLPSDLEGNVLTINKASVQGEGSEFIVKATKTASSVRKIVIPDRIADIIRERGYINRCYPSKMYYALQNACDACGVPRFPFHKLRHFFASYMHDLGTYSEAQIAEIGGWRDGSRVMKQTYRHAMEVMDASAKMAASIESLSGNGHKVSTRKRKNQ